MTTRQKIASIVTPIYCEVATVELEVDCDFDLDELAELDGHLFDDIDLALDSLDDDENRKDYNEEYPIELEDC